MTDTTQGETTDVVKRTVAKHYLLDSTGAVVEDEEQATGIRYHHIGTGQTFDYQIAAAQPGSPATMLAIFGAKTLATNEASAVRQKSGDMGDQVGAITDRFAMIDSGKWVDRTREGFKWDLDLLAQAVVAVLVRDSHISAEQGSDPAIVAKVRAKLDDKAQVTLVRQTEGVEAEYKRLSGKTTRSVADLASLVA